MKKYLILIITASLLLAATQAAQGAVYYVDFDNGNDAWDGLSKAQAWRHSPGDTNATDTPAGIALTQGDTVKFKGGARYIGSIKINRSGAVGNPIIYDGNSSGDWGAGRAVITNNNAVTDATGFEAIGARDYITIRGFEITDIGGYADNDPYLDQLVTAGQVITAPRGGVGIDLGNGVAHIRIENNYFHEIGQWLNRLPFSGADSVTGCGISLQNNDEVIIDGCEMTRMRVGISIKASNGTISNIEVKNCDLHNYMVWTIDVAPRSASGPNILSNISIHNNKIHDYAEYDSGNWLGGGEKPHTDGIFLRTAGMPSTWENIKIYNNMFYTGDRGASKGGTAAVYISQGPSVDIFNNIFANVSHSASVADGGGLNMSRGKQVVRILNNTFYNTPKIIIAGETDPVKKETYIENNIFYRNSTTANIIAVYHSSGILTALDHNLYFNPALSASIWMPFKLVNGGYMTIQQAQAKGYEVNGLWGDPRFVDISHPSNPDVSLNNFRLSEGSLAIDQITDFPTYFAADKDGISRPQSAAWDIGAYEYAPDNADISGNGAITAYDAALALQLGRGELEAAQIVQKAVGLL